MSSNEQTSKEPEGRDDIAAPDPTAGQRGDGPNEAGAAEGNEGEGADKSTDR